MSSGNSDAAAPKSYEVFLEGKKWSPWHGMQLTSNGRNPNFRAKALSLILALPDQHLPSLLSLFSLVLNEIWRLDDLKGPFQFHAWENILRLRKKKLKSEIRNHEMLEAERNSEMNRYNIFILYMKKVKAEGTRWHPKSHHQEVNHVYDWCSLNFTSTLLQQHRAYWA